jgi:predicted transglutaminase-like cysteine proteinase
VGKVFTGLFPAEDDEIYKEEEYEILPGSYQRACRDCYLEKSDKKIKAGKNNPHSYFSS